MLIALLAALCLVLLILWLAAPRTVAWVNDLTRLNPGAGEKAEWMAPPQVIETVIWDYGSAQEWLDTCADNWGRFAEGLERYTAGPYLNYQRRALASLIDRRPRLAVTLSAAHRYSVRHFTPDGLRCLLIDCQTQRTLATAQYWTGQLIHSQRLDDTALVFQMAYDSASARWKIEKLIQELPPDLPEARGAATGKTARVRLSATLPAPAGRDS